MGVIMRAKLPMQSVPHATSQNPVARGGGGRPFTGSWLRRKRHSKIGQQHRRVLVHCEGIRRVLGARTTTSTKRILQCVGMRQHSKRQSAKKTSDGLQEIHFHPAMRNNTKESQLKTIQQAVAANINRSRTPTVLGVPYVHFPLLRVCVCVCQHPRPNKGY